MQNDDMLTGVLLDGNFAISLNKKDEPKIKNNEKITNTKEEKPMRSI